MNVVCAIIFQKGQVLACQRALGKDEGGKWEFPGGKVEGGESHEEALIREIAEELAMEISVGEFLIKVTHGEIYLFAYQCEWAGGEIERREHEALRWLGVEDGDDLDWAPADIPIWRSIKERLTGIPRIAE